MKKLIYLVLVIAIVFFGYKFFTKDNNPKPVVQQNPEWISLFDGKTFDGWHGYNTDSISSSWSVEDGCIVFTPIKGKRGGNIVTDKEFTNFKLSLEWKISEGGNSGIFWGVREDEKYRQPYSTGPEIQILDNDKHADGQYETHRAGSLYDMIAPSEEVVRPVGEWNICEIEIDHTNNTGNVWLNTIHVISFDVHGEKWDTMVSNSKFKDWEGFGVYQTGRIGLQDHGDKVSFRNIKIRELY
jgi:hypothetical protein